MSKPNYLTQIVKGAKSTMVKHGPEILTGIGVAGMITTTILAVKATPKALLLLEEEKVRQTKESDEIVDELSVVDTVKTTWKCYIPAGVTGLVSVACLIGAASSNGRRISALSAAYHLSETALTDYKKAVLETIGEKKEKEVREKVAENKLATNPIPTDSSDIVVTSKGTTLCYDVLSGQYFKSSIDAIKDAENEMNRRMLSDMYISVNELYSHLGLRETKNGNDLGWNLDNGYLKFYYSSKLAEDGTPCLVLDYNNSPKYEYSKLVY